MALVLSPLPLLSIEYHIFYSPDYFFLPARALGKLEKATLKKKKVSETYFVYQIKI